MPLPAGALLNGRRRLAAHANTRIRESVDEDLKDLSKAPCHLLCDADRKFPSFRKFLEISVAKKLRKPLICMEGPIS